MLKNTDGSELKYADLAKEELLLLKDLEARMKRSRKNLILLAFEPNKEEAQASRLRLFACPASRDLDLRASRARDERLNGPQG